jgi:hypothetical protein
MGRDGLIQLFNLLHDVHPGLGHLLEHLDDGDSVDHAKMAAVPGPLEQAGFRPVGYLRILDLRLFDDCVRTQAFIALLPARQLVNQVLPVTAQAVTEKVKYLV